MKNSVKITAILLLSAIFSTGAFAAKKVTSDVPEPAQDVVSFTALTKDCGVGVIIHKAAPGKSSVAIYDAKGSEIFNDALPKNAKVDVKGYLLNDLQDGDYTIAVTTGNELVKRTVHVYSDENDQKGFYFEL